MMPPAREVSVIIPVRDHQERLAACVAALARQQTRYAVEIILVDNHDQFYPADYAAIDAGSLPIRVTHEPRIGSYAARNRGIALAQGRVCAFTDADCLPQPDWIEQGVRAAVAGSGVIGGAVTMTFRQPRRPTWAEQFDSAYYLDQRRYVVSCGFAATANLFVRRDLFEAVGLFDAALQSGGDQEWCLRAARAGHAAQYAPDAVVWHPARATWTEILRKARRIDGGYKRSTPTTAGAMGLFRHARLVASSMRQRAEIPRRRVMMTLVALSLLHSYIALRRYALRISRKCLPLHETCDSCDFSFSLRNQLDNLLKTCEIPQKDVTGS